MIYDSFFPKNYDGGEMLRMEYLRVNDKWVIRGTKEIPRLYNWYNNRTIKLNNDVLKYIMECDGTRNLMDICKKYNIEQEIADKFYKQFIIAGVIELVEEKDKRNIDVNLGEKEPWLKEVHLDVTDHCNLRCRHCFWGDNLTCNENVPVDKWKKLILELKNIGVGKVVVSGGEAFTRDDLFEIVKACFDNKIFLGAIFTNGTIKSESVKQILEFIIKKEIETSFYISMDGYNSEQHDFIRGNGKFEVTLDFVKKLVNIRKTTGARYKILINSLIHKKNYLHLIEWYDFLEQLGIDSWRFTTGRITGALEKNVSDIKLLSSEYFPQYIKLTEYAISRYKAGKGINLNVENFFNTRYLDRGKVFLFSEKNLICDYKTNACSIDPYGNVQFCTGWQNIKYGNVFEQNISHIWYSNKLQKLKEFKVKDIYECQNCRYLKYCGGGCRLECKDIILKMNLFVKALKCLMNIWFHS